MSSPESYMNAGWLHAKLLLVIVLSGYHGWLKTRLRAFAEQRNDKSAKFYRVMNEVPSVLLLAIIIPVVVKPFRNVPHPQQRAPHAGLFLLQKPFTTLRSRPCPTDDHSARRSS